MGSFFPRLERLSIVVSFLSLTGRALSRHRSVDFITIALLPEYPLLPPLKTATHRVPHAGVTAVPEESGLNNAPQETQKKQHVRFLNICFSIKALVKTSVSDTVALCLSVDSFL